MAEVGHRLGNGAYRLSAVRTVRGRSVFTGERSRTTGARTRGGATEETSPCRIRECQPLLKRKAAERRADKLSRPGLSRPGLSGDVDSEPANPFSKVVENRENIRARNKTAVWSKTRGVFLAATVHPETFRSPQQLREFCTFLLRVSRLKYLKRHADTLQPSAATRCYSNTKDVPPLHRSKTAYYDILNVSPGATQSQIKTAYYKQSFMNHPDRNPGSEEATRRFSEISEAYTVLGNMSLRRKYDRGILSQWDVQGAGRPSSSSREATAGRTSGSQQQQRARPFSQSGGEPMFDFDAFYQAHYGEQLQREREARARKQRLQEKQREDFTRWKRGKLMEVTVGMLMTVAAVILVSLRR